MFFAISIINDASLGSLFIPYVIKQVSQKDYFKNTQRVTSESVLKYDFLQEDWINDIINLTNHFTPQNLNVKFNKKHKKQKFQQFFDKATKPEIAYIHKTLDIYKSQLIQILKKNQPHFYKQKNQDQYIYPSDFLKYENDYAQVKFNFRKEDSSLYYKLHLFLYNKEVVIQNNELLILCNESPCIIFQNSLFWFDQNTGFNGNKLKPFLIKEEIVIPDRMQEIYFEKFVKNAVNNFEYTIKGFPINYIETSKNAILTIEKTFTNQFIITVHFTYNEKNIPHYWEQQEFVKVIQIGENYGLESFRREAQFEQVKIEKLLQLGLVQTDKYFDIPITYKIESEFVNYLKPLIPKFYKAGFVIKNRLFKKPISFETPVISYINSNKNKQDWFDLYITIQFKNFEIDFIEFKNHILNNTPEFELPDGSIFLIPKEWFSELNAFANKTSKDNKTGIHFSNYSLLENNEIIIPDVDIETTIDGFTTNEKIDLPKHSTAILRDYQDIGYQWISRNTQNKFGVCLADDMGLGKTLQVITVLQKYFEDKTANNSLSNQSVDLFSFTEQTDNNNTYKSTLLILPRVLMINWKEELQKFAPELSFSMYYGSKRNEIIPKYLHKKNLIITTYGTVRQDIELLSNLDFSYIVLDESQAIKNPNSKIYNAVIQLQSDYKISITGTPIENRLTDIWSQMNFLNPNMLGNLNYFKNTYLNANMDAPEIDDLKTIINPFILRRLKKNVAKELPDKIEQIIHCQMDILQQKQYDEEKSIIRNELLFKDEKNMFNVLSVLNRLRQFVLHPKLVDKNSEITSGKYNEIISIMDTLISQGNKFLVFSSFTKHLDIYKSYFEENNISFSLLTGKTKNPQEIVKEYQESETVKPFLISIKAGGVGLNITSANYVLIIDPWWNPFVELQAIDRTHRIGQTKNVFVYKFITKNSIEEKILKLQNKKMAMSDSLINEGTQINISMKEVMEIL